MGILVQMVNPGGIEAAGTSLNAMHYVALLQEQLGKVTAVLTCDPSNKGGFGSRRIWHRDKYLKMQTGTTQLQKAEAGGSIAQPPQRQPGNYHLMQRGKQGCWKDIRNFISKSYYRLLLRLANLHTTIRAI